ncbi:MAG TPA: hypothetical protein VGP90_06260 [Acidimicrobiia bacterium]|nr:hypothetical protein [Acidimicrobiia bacterium]
MATGIRFAPVVALVVVGGLVAGGCGGGGHSYKAGTPAATGAAPTDCAAVPLDLVKETLDIDVTGPGVSPHPGGGVSCTFPHARGGGNATESVQINGNVTPQTFNLPRDGLKAANNPVKKISGWGDEAYAATVRFVVNLNSFAVRKGKVSVSIQSTADYDHVKKLMKAVLAKL